MLSAIMLLAELPVQTNKIFFNFINITNNGICNPKLVKILDKNPAIVQPTTPKP